MESVNRHEVEADNEALIGVLWELVDRIPYIAPGSLKELVANFDKIDVERELDYVLGRQEVEHGSSHQFELFAIPEDTGATIMIHIQSDVENNSSFGNEGPRTFMEKEYYWFIISHDEEGKIGLATEYSRSYTKEFANGKRITIDKWNGVITGDRLLKLEFLIDLGKFDDAFDAEQAGMSRELE